MVQNPNSNIHEENYNMPCAFVMQQAYPNRLR